MTKPQALITTPTENTECPTCMGTWLYYLGVDGNTDRAGSMPTTSRFPGDTNTFAHCDECGTTDLVDTRSVFEVLVEARRNADAVRGTDRWFDRYDVAEQVEVLALQADPHHCSDCEAWARRAGM